MPATAPQTPEDDARLRAAVKADDGFFTTFFVSSYSPHVVRWAAGRGLTPNQVTVCSMLVGALAAAGFATGERWGLIAGAVALQAAFLLDCVDGQLARYTQRFSRVGAWLDSVFDRTKEYLVYAGLAIGASRTGDPQWLLAGAALALQTVRHVFDFSFTHDPEAAATGGVLAIARRHDAGALSWVKKVIAFPIGERFAAISLTAAIWSAHTTFVVLLVWGAIAGMYALAGRLARALRGTSGRTPSPRLSRYRDDGPLAVAIGRLGRAVPLAPAALIGAGIVPGLLAIALDGSGASDAVAIACAAWLVVLGALSAGRPLDDRLRWMVPPLVRAGEYGAILWLAALAGESALAGAFALLAAAAYRQYDLIYRDAAPPAWTAAAALGWEGRVIAVAILLAAGALPAGLYVLAAAIAILLVTQSVLSWTHDPQEAAAA